MKELIQKWENKLNKLMTGTLLYTQYEKEVPKELIERISLINEFVEDLKEIEEELK
jgi:hypothetical protein